eukprot:364615-Chlamydomonas_euryale.AAC.7
MPARLVVLIVKRLEGFIQQPQAVLFQHAPLGFFTTGVPASPADNMHEEADGLAWRVPLARACTLGAKLRGVTQHRGLACHARRGAQALVLAHGQPNVHECASAVVRSHRVDARVEEVYPADRVTLILTLPAGTRCRHLLAGYLRRLYHVEHGRFFPAGVMWECVAGDKAFVEHDSCIIMLFLYLITQCDACRLCQLFCLLAATATLYQCIGAAQVSIYIAKQQSSKAGKMTNVE